MSAGFSVQESGYAYFKQNVTDEVQGEASEVLIARHVQVLGEALDSGIGNCIPELAKFEL